MINCSHPVHLLWHRIHLSDITHVSDTDPFSGEVGTPPAMSHRNRMNGFYLPTNQELINHALRVAEERKNGLNSSNAIVAHSFQNAGNCRRS
ncbi:unnamed protein product [Periconia digitata]|uniref:Uncharacterized protein n=1 Tax=Periconia digitata TaxID=1303443 RepID=A0A9W4XHQ4_9PLEO|nr:unnamed protein product [Periconia digitata]